ncbi:MAG: hypothetical protein JSU65_07680 [Candidatus Zixiibacteriota bacterium]|nr:MAG: hypothetical protein JSU65_07680 [candidate division Zixibacteria bacterium]
MLKMKTVLLSCLVAVFSSNPAAGDSTEPAADSTVEDINRVDTLLFQPTIDTAKALLVTNPVNFERHLTQTPTIALFKSMFVPGWGQIGNRRYFKAAVIIGLESWFIYSAVQHGRDASDYRAQWEAATDLYVRRSLYDSYEFSRDKRNKFTWFAGITIFVSMFDAYVDAHLSGSPREERNNRIELEVQPDDSGGANARLSYRF